MIRKNSDILKWAILISINIKYTILHLFGQIIVMNVRDSIYFVRKACFCHSEKILGVLSHMREKVKKYPEKFLLITSLIYDITHVCSGSILLVRYDFAPQVEGLWRWRLPIREV